MLKVAVILLTLFNCITGEVNTANTLLPLARTDVSLSLSNSSMLVERIIADPKFFVSQMASADPVVIRNVIGMLKLLNHTGTTAVIKFEEDVTEAKADEDAKIKIHDDLSSLVENLTKTEENLAAEKLIVTATIVTKTEEKRVAGLDKTAAVAHHTSMVAERDANVPDLTTDNAAISSVISILEGLLPAPTAAPTTAAPTTAAPTTASPTTASPTTVATTTAETTKVRISLDGKSLNLAEVEVYDEDNTLLEPLSASLSTLYHPNYPASLCIDGNLDNFCHSSDAGGDLVLDFVNDASVDTVVITNRRGCCQNRIVGAVISVIIHNVVSWSYTITDIQDVYSLSLE